jgi:predicted dehydrogenase
MNRREFLKGTAAAGVWLASAPRLSASPNEKLAVGMIGVAGMRGGDHLRAMASENIAALCDVDATFLEKAGAAHPKAARYSDFREMLEKEKTLDAVVVSTPDHIHAPAAVMAMRMGKHVYVEKPLAHTVSEARLMAETAAKHKVATQMGTQIHAEPNYRRVVEKVQAGAIGSVREVHVWLGRTPWTASGLPKSEEPPAHLHWDLWVGPARERPYSKRYHPQGWRCYWNFGGGHLADMGCHFIDLPFWALKLRHPLTAEAEGPPVDEHGAPPWLVARWQFPARGELPPVALTWYHGEKQPPQLEEGKLGDWKGAGVLFVGEKGLLVSNYGAHRVLPEAAAPEKAIPDSPGHHREWIEAAKGGKPALCNFDYSGALTEAVLLGNVAYRVGKKLEWDAGALKATNSPEADRFIRREYRKGWSL